MARGTVATAPTSSWQASTFTAPFLMLVAFQILSRVAEQIDLSGIIIRIAHVWRQLTHGIWHQLVTLLPEFMRFPISDNQADGLTLSVLFVGAIVLRMFGFRMFNEMDREVSKTPGLEIVLFLLSYVIVLYFFIAPYSWNIARIIWVWETQAWDIGWLEKLGVIISLPSMALTIIVAIVWPVVHVANAGRLDPSSSLTTSLIGQQVADVRTADAMLNVKTFVQMFTLGLVIMHAAAQSDAAVNEWRAHIMEKMAAYAQLGFFSRIGAGFVFMWQSVTDASFWVWMLLSLIFALGMWLAVVFNPRSIPRAVIFASILLLADRLIIWLGPTLQNLNTQLQVIPD